MKSLSVLFLSAWFALAATAPAHAGFIAAAIGAIGTFLTSGTLLANIALSVIGFGIKLGVSLLTKAKQGRKSAGIETEMQTGGDNPLSFIMGHFATAGQLVYANTSGESGDTPNAYLTLVISISDLPVNSLTGLWANDTKCVVPDMSGTAPDTRGWYIDEFNDGSDHTMFIRFHDGTETAPDPYLINTYGGDPDRPFTADMIGRGVAYVVMTVQFKEKLYSGIPSFVFETDGIKLYDIRKDTTAGGNGKHRWDNPATWGPSDNPIVQAYNVVRGIRYDGDWIYGGQTISAFQLPAANVMAAANACDQSITNKDGSTEKQFRAGGEITCDREPLDTVEDLMKGCNGRFAEIGGMFKVTVGAPGAPVYSFTDETIIVTEAAELDPFPGLEDTVNGAHASYPEPVEKWASKDAPPYIRTDLEAEDDGRRMLADVQLPFTPYALQVQRILQAIVQDHRRFRQHQFFLPPEAWVLEPNDVVAWTSTRNGYENKKFILTSIDGGSNFIQGVSLKEVDPDDYSWNSATDERPYSTGVLGEIIPPAQLITGWQVLPAAFLDDTGDGKRPSIEVFFAGGQIDVDGVRVQVRLKSSQAVVFDSTIPYDAPLNQQYSVILNGIFLPDTNYEVRGIYTSISGRAFEWSAWLPVKTDDIRIGSGDIYPIDLGDLDDDVAGYLDFVGDGLREVVDWVRDVSRLTTEQDAGNYQDKQTLRRELRSTFRDAKAEWTLDIAVATGPGSAIVQRIEDLEVEVNDNLASAVDSLTTQINQNGDDIDALSASLQSLTVTVGTKASASSVTAVSSRVTVNENKITANSNSITTIGTTVGKFAAAGKFRVETVATESGAQATVGLSAAATYEGDTTQASLFLSALANGKSRVTVVSDQFVVTDGGANKRAPLLFQNGELYLNVANIGTVNTGVLQSPDGKMVINLTQGNITVSD